MRARLFSHLRPTPATAVAVAALVFALTALAGPASSSPPPGTNGKGQVTVVTLTGGPVSVDTPGETAPVPITLAPSSATSFTQKAGEAVTITMAATIEGPESDEDHPQFCDIHAAVDLTSGGTESNETALRMNRIFNRGGPWWDMVEQGRDATRTIPAPASDAPHTVIAVAWMDEFNGEPLDVDCFGGHDPNVYTVNVRVSIVTLKN